MFSTQAMAVCVMEGDMHRGDLRERVRFPSAMPKSHAAFARVTQCLDSWSRRQISMSSNFSAASSAQADDEADQKQCTLGVRVLAVANP
jgi:hypothetical protein